MFIPCTTQRVSRQVISVLTAASLLVLVLLLGYVHGQDRQRSAEDEVTRKKKALSDIEKSLQKKKEELTQAEHKEYSTINQLNTIDKQLSEKHNELSRLNSRLEQLTTEALSMDGQQKKMNQEMASQEKLLQARLIALYKYRRSGGILRTAFASQSYADLSQKIKYLTMIVRQDRAIIEGMNEARALSEQRKGALMENQQALEKTRARTLDTESQISKQKKDKSALLETIRSEKELYLAAVRELEHSSQQLQSLIDELEKQLEQKQESFTPTPGKGFATLKGSLSLPATGNIISRFGNRTDPTLNMVFFQKGIEIEAKQGEAIRAIYDGKVLYADWFKGYGNMIIVDHGDGYYSLSAHLSEIVKNVGEPVEAGEVIAFAGDTGSLKGPCLYFELRYHGKPLDPEQWLQVK